ncbi:MAG: hypothetical protein M3Z20_07830 [Chloroflexota bacterium]|nr:hypothetical protein [Chloroflexota bacterium]
MRTSDAHLIGLTRIGERWQAGTEMVSDGSGPLTDVVFDLTPFRGAYARVVVVDRDGRAWSNPVWVEPAAGALRTPNQPEKTP